MKLEEMVTLLRSAGVESSAVDLAINAWQMGAECEREECAAMLEAREYLHDRNDKYKDLITTACAKAIRNRGEIK